MSGKMLPALNAKGGMSGDLAGNFTLHPVPGGKSVLGPVVIPSFPLDTPMLMRNSRSPAVEAATAPAAAAPTVCPARTETLVDSSNNWVLAENCTLKRTHKWP